MSGRKPPRTNAEDDAFWQRLLNDAIPGEVASE